MQLSAPFQLYNNLAMRLLALCQLYKHLAMRLLATYMSIAQTPSCGDISSTYVNHLTPSTAELALC
jgi:hypothetical protein